MVGVGEFRYCWFVEGNSGVSETIIIIYATINLWMIYNGNGEKALPLIDAALDSGNAERLRVQV